MASDAIDVTAGARRPFTQARAQELVYGHVRARLEKTDVHVTFSPEDVYVVSFMYILGHWKAMVSTTLPDGMYYELTHNSAKNETYLDSYKKWDNVVIPDTTS